MDLVRTLAPYASAQLVAVFGLFVVRPDWRRTAQRLAAVDVVVVIDRCFRYVQMLVTTTLIAVVARAIFTPASAQVVSIVLAGAAGLYLTVPLARWLTPERDLPGDRHAKRDRGLFVAGTAFMMTLTSLYYAGLATDLIANSIRLDGRVAQAAYRNWNYQMSEAGCLRGGQSYESAEKCMNTVRKHYGIPPVKR